MATFLATDAALRTGDAAIRPDDDDDDDEDDEDNGDEVECCFAVVFTGLTWYP